jgi:hypothetical protein
LRNDLPPPQWWPSLGGDHPELPNRAKGEFQMAVDLTYQWGEVFQLRLLSYLIRDPEKMFDLVESQFFTSPMFVEISRVRRVSCSSKAGWKRAG